VREIQIFSKSLDKNLDYLEKSWASQIISMISISLDDLDKSLDSLVSITKVSIIKISTEKKKDDLDPRENLNTLKKLVSTRRTFSISIGLNCREHQS
jgi:hypothetical protein